MWHLLIMRIIKEYLYFDLASPLISLLCLHILVKLVREHRLRTVCRGLSGILCTNTAYFIVSKSFLSPVANILFPVTLWKALNRLETPRGNRQGNIQRWAFNFGETIKCMVISETFFFGRFIFIPICFWPPRSTSYYLRLLSPLSSTLAASYLYSSFHYSAVFARLLLSPFSGPKGRMAA